MSNKEEMVLPGALFKEKKGRGTEHHHKRGNQIQGIRTRAHCQRVRKEIKKTRDVTQSRKKDKGRWHHLM